MKLFGFWFATEDQLVTANETFGVGAFLYFYVHLYSLRQKMCIYEAHKMKYTKLKTVKVTINYLMQTKLFINIIQSQQHAVVV